jgi:hypothetical protein
MRFNECQRVNRIRRHLYIERCPLAVEATQHGVRQTTRADPVTAFCQLHCLGDGSIRGYTTHVEQLICAES